MAEANEEQRTYEKKTVREVLNVEMQDLKKNPTDSEFETEVHCPNHSKVDIFPCN